MIYIVTTPLGLCLAWGSLELQCGERGVIFFGHIIARIGRLEARGTFWQETAV